jgi:hypothetical protein
VWLLQAPPAFGFVEDICFPPGGGAPYNCSPLPAVCQPVGTTSPMCLTAAVAAFAALGVEGKVVNAERSIMHADCVNLLAQAVGFSTDDANWISSYGEVPDYGQFQPTDMNGQPYGSYQTAQMNGFQRSNFGVGGGMFHYIALYSGGTAAPPPGVDGLHPSTHAPRTEYFISHMRSWAMAGGGTSPPLCTAGLTNRSSQGDYATGSGCFVSSGNPAPVTWSLSLVLGQTTTSTFNTGLQVLDSSSDTTVLSSDFDTRVGGGAARVADARLGIYLHMLADRISHHACTDLSAMAGPTATGASTWSLSETAMPYCGQDYHSLYHMWEIGVPFAQVPAAQRTTEAALNLLYDELLAFAQARNTARAGADNAAAKATLVSAILSALQTPAADARIAAVASVACANGYQPFPGTPACGQSPAAAAVSRTTKPVKKTTK